MKNKTLLVIFSCVLVLSAAISAFSGVIAADTSTDPLITMSYVEEVLVPRLKSELMTYIEKNFSFFTGPDVPSDSYPEVSANANYTVINMKKGQVLLAKSSSEIILRSGIATAVTPFVDQGLSDMTAGAELMNGDSIPKNHYCLIPRGDDGRGLVAVSDEIYIMVRGEFEISE